MRERHSPASHSTLQIEADPLSQLDRRAQRGVGREDPLLAGAMVYRRQFPAAFGIWPDPRGGDGGASISDGLDDSRGCAGGFRRCGASAQFMSGDEFELNFLSQDEFELKSMDGETTRYNGDSQKTRTSGAALC